MNKQKQTKREACGFWLKPETHQKLIDIKEKSGVAISRQVEIALRFYWQSVEGKA